MTPIETQRAVWPKAERVRKEAAKKKRQAARAASIRQKAAKQRQQVAIDKIQRLMLQHGLKAKDLGQLFQ